ncbi:MAG: NAD(P)(+) transhydrogenase (Re/Si-specific) subunit beta [Myxococcota bacterium]
MPESLPTIGYLAAAILFILSLGGLSQQKTARRGNVFGIIGMALAITMTFAITEDISWAWSAGPIAVGAALGAMAAARVEMTSMPELVAILHSFVGLAAVLVGVSTFLNPDPGMTGAAHTIHLVEIYIDVAIGAVTFTGSVVAWGKLGGRITSDPFKIPGRHVVNLLMVLGIVAVGVYFAVGGPVDSLTLLLINAGIAAVLGAHLVMAIGGADMPVVVSLLNSYSGWAAAAAGFMLSNDLLIITGALVGSSGAILSYIMCRGMNRSLVNVIFGGFDTGGSAAASTEAGPQGDAQSASSEQVAELLERAETVVIVPGYGMAVAQAQHAVSQLTKRLRRAGKTIKFGIHPVAGRMPGHMNVLLAEADIPYDIVHEMEDVNDDFGDTDVVLVVGANDIVNPDAKTDKSSPIYGMPQLEVWHASTVVVLKRSLSPGYAGVPNPLFFRENTLMYFGDAEDSLNKLLDVM